MARDENRDSSDLDDLTAGLADDGAPVDLAAVRRDDALIEAISHGGPVATDSTEQYELALILSKWRDDVVSTPMPEGPLLDDVIAAIESAPPALPIANVLVHVFVYCAPLPLRQLSQRW